MVVQEVLHQLSATPLQKQQLLLEEQGKHLGGEDANTAFTSPMLILCHKSPNFQSPMKLVLCLAALILQCTVYNINHLPRVT